MRLTHIGLCVSDPDRSQRFYQEAFGFRYVRRLEVRGEPADTLLDLEDVDLHAIYLERDGTTIELLHFASPSAVGDPAARRPLNLRGLTHLSFLVEDPEQVVADVVRHGGRVLDESRVPTPRDPMALFCADPDGTLIELVRRTDG